MGLNDTPSGERIHIGFFGRRNAGKSSVVNAVTGQGALCGFRSQGHNHRPGLQIHGAASPGAGSDHRHPRLRRRGRAGGAARQKTKQVLNRADCAVLVVDAAVGKTPADEELISLFQEKEIPYLVAYNKSDLGPVHSAAGQEISISALKRQNITELKERIAQLVKAESFPRKLGDLLSPGRPGGAGDAY